MVRPFDWLVVTSQRAARVVARLQAENGQASGLGPTRVAAVGPATASSLRDSGIRVDLVGTGSGAAELAGSILRAPGLQRPLRVLWPRAVRADRALAGRLRARGAIVREIAIYESFARRIPVRARFEQQIERGGIAAVCFFASSAARSFLGQIDPAAKVALGGTLVASFGAGVTRELRRNGVRPDVETRSGRIGEFAEDIASAVRERHARQEAI